MRANEAVDRDAIVRTILLLLLTAVLIMAFGETEEVKSVGVESATMGVAPIALAQAYQGA